VGEVVEHQRLIAIVRKSIRAEAFLMWLSFVFSGWKASGMKVWNPPVSSLQFAQTD